jgi:hypothetical protein
VNVLKGKLIVKAMEARTLEVKRVALVAALEIDPLA